MSIVDFMRVRPPYPPSAGVRRNDITGIKLARHVAVLFGVDVPENPTDTVWVSDFNKVTVGDVGRGAPKLTAPRDKKLGHLPLKGWYLVDRALVAGPIGKAGEIGTTPAIFAGGVDEVPSATLNRFKPDTKAAALLTGAEQLFAGLEEVYRDTIRVLGILDDGSSLADNMRIGVWASLVAETYRCQPALFSAVVQARLAQRAALSTWKPVVPAVQAAESASCEFGEKGNEDYWEPVTLGILDGVIRNHVRPSISPQDSLHSLLRNGQSILEVEKPTGSEAEGSPGSETEGSPGSDDPNRDYLIDGLVDRWCRHLTQSSDRGLMWTVQEQRHRTVEIYLSGQVPLSRFLAEVHLLYPMVLPYGMQNQEDNWQRFDPADEEHRRRVRPRIPSRAEMGQVPEKSRMAIVHTLICLQRTLRSGAEFKHPQMTKEVSDDQQRVADLSESLWGPNAALSALSRHLWLRGRISSGRERDVEFVAKNWPSFMDGLRLLRCLREEGKLSAGEWVDIFAGTSPILNARSRDLAATGFEPEAKALRAELMEDWQDVLRILNINVDLESENSSELEAPDTSMTGLAMLLHNYLGSSLRMESDYKRLSAVRFGQKVVLPLRRMVSEDRKNDSAVRLSIQIIARAAARLATLTTDEAIRNEMLEASASLLEDLLKTKLVKELMGGKRTPKDASDLNVCNAISEAALTLLESESKGTVLNMEETLRILNMSSAALAALSGDKPASPEKASDRTRDVQRYRDRWNKLAAKRAS